MLAIAGGKGGCGKTTTVLGLARSFARTGTTPLVVDADCDMPDVHHVAGIHRGPQTGQPNLELPLEDVVHTAERFPGVCVLTARRREFVDSVLRRARDWSGPVLVDCPPGTSADTVRPLRYADSSLVVTTDQPACLEDSVRTVRTLRQLGTAPLGAVLVARSGEGGPTAIAGCRVLGTPPFVDEPFDNETVRRTWELITSRLKSDTVTSAQALIKQRRNQVSNGVSSYADSDT